ncbi:MAG: HAMP domain-containing protein [Deltaproteobacteria bacterium]|nr:HAMP domain-containing protein [Deltaproteobacteria bacterium]
MNLEPPGEAPEEAPSRWALLWKRLRRLSLRTRLVLAFVLLIVSSASATILIGSAVFGQKVDEMARSSAGLYRKLAAQVFDLQLERLETAVQSLARVTDVVLLAERLRVPARAELPVDFAVRWAATGVTVFERRAVGGGAASGDLAYAVRVLSGDERLVLDGTALGGAAERAREQRTALTGLVVLPGAHAGLLGVPPQTEDQLLTVAVVSTSAGVTLLGRRLNDNVALLRPMAELIHPRNPRFGATVFLQERRIATIVGGADGTAADPRVVRTVLGEGRVYTGVADVAGTDYYASYQPLRDLDGRIVGMFGVGEGIGEDAYAEIRRRTVALFSSLIAGGMVFGFLMTYLFSVWLVRPIRELAAGMSRVAEGDLGHKVRIESADELGRLARAFNRMVRAVKERDNRLREMTADRLSAVERQVSAGRLAAGVAHEINNPLTAILSLSSLLLKKALPEASEREDLEIIVAETTRCREIVKGLLDFARERPMAKRIVDLREVLRDTMRLTAKYEPLKAVTLETRFPDYPLYVNGDPKLLQQVFTNLLTNAAEACEGRGTVRLTADEDASGGFVEVRFADTGKGIPAEHLARIFEPFFTTKGARKGTGLGLSVSLGIVQKHEGTIDVRSDEGQGTTVTVTLPRWEWL